MMTKKTNTKTLIEAMRILARDIQSDDGVANGAISEAADRMEELQAQRDQLREALERISAVTFTAGPEYGLMLARIAIEALQEDRDE